MITIQRLFISPEHNYHGHHGQAAGENQTLEVTKVECVGGRGIRHDRFFDHKPDYKGQITFFSAEVFEGLRHALGLEKADPSQSRRNALVCGVDLNSLIGEDFEIQGVRFTGTEECKPCHWMDKAFAPGAERWLKGRGGLRARILTDGVLRVNA